MNTTNLPINLVLICLLLMATVFVIDLQLPLGVAGGIPYVAVIIVSLWFKNQNYVIGLAIICTILTFIGFYFSPIGGELWKVITNRGLAIFAIWTTAVLATKWGNTLMQVEQYTLKSNKILEEQVELRTREYLQAKEEAEKANNAKSVFLSSMSHELRTPLNAILGFSQLIKMNTKDEKSKESSQEIINAGNHLLILINEILDLSKIESGNIELSIEKCCLNESLNNTLTLINPIAEKYSIHIDNKVSTSFNINVDEMRFKQVLLNILSNAIKYNSENGKVIIDSSTEKNMLRLSISDTGKGLTPEQQISIFQPFDRAGAENSNIEGTGLGLSITKNLLEKMDGKITVESMLGEGSCFCIQVPLS